MIITQYINKLTPKRLLRLAVVASVAALSAALVAQYGFDLHPCHLCMLQRYPYAAIATIAALTAWRGSPKTQIFVAFACAALFFLDAGIAFYHTGVEYGWFPGPSGCTNTSSAGQSIEDLRAQIMNAPLVTCDQAAAYFFGLSMAAWNFVVATGAGAATFYAARALRKKPA
jgi:disulfide bond formation protein DsbB